MRILIGAAALPICLFAQTPLAFEAASIKPASPESGNSLYYRTPPGGRVSSSNTTLKLLIQNTYHVRQFQVVGGPGWVATQGWDIEAVPGKSATSDERDEMLKTLLSDRFQLAFHRESKELPVYNLVVAKGGHKLKSSADPPAAGNIHAGSIAFKTTTVSTLTNVLSGVLGRKVIDKTGLNGNFEVDLHWTPDDTTDDGGPSVFTAIQEQLGLRLESSKGPVDVIVIDRAEKPSNN